jgi:iron complex transport system substrate-binding protein
MIARTGAFLAILLALSVSCAPRQSADSSRRIVSLVPAITEILFAIGAGPDVVGVSSYDILPPDAPALPRVGALLDPDTERILALQPDLVITYGSQADLETRFGRAGIRVFSYRHVGITATLDLIRELGAVTERATEAERLAADLQAQVDRVRALVRGRPRPRTLLVFGRQPGTLRGVYASGAVGFLSEILDVAGGDNVFADIARESVQPSQETLLARAPDVIIEVRATAPDDPELLQEPRASWATLASLPAVRTGRIHALAGQYLVVPGPRLGETAEALARVLHPEAFDAP